MENKVTVTNISSATIVINSPELRIRRELIPGRTIAFSHEDFEQLMFDPGFESLIKDHYLAVNGLEEENAPVVDYEKAFSSSEIERMLDNLDITSFARFIPTAREAERDTVVKLAIEKGITNTAFVTLIKKYCDVDIISAINMKHQVEG